MKTNLIIPLWIGVNILFASCSHFKVFNLSDYGLQPNSGENASPLMRQALESIQDECTGRQQVIIKLAPGRYDFHPDGAAEKTCFISNHDQDNPKRVALSLEDMNNITFDGQGAELIFHGRMLPVSLMNSTNCTLQNFHIDFENPHISQVKILENDTLNGAITYEIAPWVQYEIRDSMLVSKGEGWELVHQSGIAFEAHTKRLLYQTSDIHVGTRQVAEVAPRIIRAFRWNNKQLTPGTVVAMRSWKRPTPGIFVSHSNNTTLKNIQIHYAEGMGLLAQMSENITLDSLSVCLRNADDPRYFTTQADATHFSGCKGKIISRNGLYEGMMDDAINVHGTYLKVVKRVDDHTLHGRYMHGQCYGFDWGYPGDTVQFIQAATMELIDTENTIKSIQPVDQPTVEGAKEFRITFTQPIDSVINESQSFGIENLSCTPEVYFAHNIIRNNRARGALFSTPRATVVEENLFDHTSGTAILLCGDCNGWYETGACRYVLIQNNTFINALTSMFQFTNAIISIYPEIPCLKEQKKYFHCDIVIKDNRFETFDTPILYAKSVDGLMFHGNTIVHNSDYPPFHWNKHPFLFQRVVNFSIVNNNFDQRFNSQTDIKVE